MNANGLYSVAAPSPADLTAYHDRISEVGLAEASYEFVLAHAARLMAGAPVVVVEVPTVVDLDAYRDRRQT